MAKNIQSRLATTLHHAIVFCMVALFVIQAYRALDKYSKKDTMMLTELEEPERQVFPSVTICKNSMRDGFRENLEDFEFNSVLDNWLKFEFDSKEKSSGDLTDKDVACFTFTPPKKVRPGLEHWLIMNITSSSKVIMLHLHDSNQNLPFVTDTFGNAVFILPPVEQNITHTIDLAVDTVKTLKLSTTLVPCKSDRDYSSKRGLFECLEEYFEQNNDCTLPWNVEEQTKSGNKKCSNGTNFESDLLDVIIDRPFHSHVYNITKCQPYCEQLKYTYKKPFELKEPQQANDPNFTLRIYMSPNGVLFKKEVLVFDALEMIGNIGGYLGMLLGWSVLSFFTTGCKRITKTVLV